MNRLKAMTAVGAALLLGTAASAQQPAQRIASPRGMAATEIGGTWQREQPDGPNRYVGGRWIEIDYGRPILRQRENIFGSGAEFGKALNAGAPIWRGGANKSTRLMTQAPLMIGGTRVEPGEYSIFIDLQPDNWTFVLSSWGAQDRFDREDTENLWGSFRYTPDKDVARAPMQVTRLDLSVDQLTWGFVDVTANSGRMAIWWDGYLATVPFTLAQ